MRVAPKDLGSRVRVLELESQKRKTESKAFKVQVSREGHKKFVQSLSSFDVC